MPKLACWSCGRQLYTVAPMEALFAEERRCPRCGAYLHDERLLTLEDTVEFFNLVLGDKLSPQEKQDLVAFLRTL